MRGKRDTHALMKGVSGETFTRKNVRACSMPARKWRYIHEVAYIASLNSKANDPDLASDSQWKYRSRLLERIKLEMKRVQLIQGSRVSFVQ